MALFHLKYPRILSCLDRDIAVQSCSFSFVLNNDSLLTSYQHQNSTSIQNLSKDKQATSE
jgi:hypothetical protein